MFRVKIFFTLLLNGFSLKKDNLKYISWKRFFLILIVYPGFLIHFLVNWFFLLLDEILFPSFRKVPTSKTAFIIGIPRSATTFIFHKLLEDKNNFHAFRLWELLFAPSISQKYLYLGLGKLNNLMGSPFSRLSKWIDKNLFAKEEFVEIHNTGLFIHEEDEMLFLLNYSSAFFYFFFPQTKLLEKLIHHDRDLPESFKKVNMRFYKNCIRRHNYVFDRKNQRYYLSKSPTFTSKLNSIYDTFPDAKFIHPLRTPIETIPSTISLMAANYAKFCHMYEAYPLQSETRDLLVEWYLYTDDIFRNKIKSRVLTVLYPDLKKDLDGCFFKIYHFLELPKEDYDIINGKQVKKGEKHKSKHRYDRGLGIDRNLIKKKLRHILPAEIEF